MRTQTATISPRTVRIVLTGKRTMRSIQGRIYDASDVRASRLALDRLARLRVEEVEAARVDSECGGAPDRDPSPRADTSAHSRPPGAVAEVDRAATRGSGSGGGGI
jgi:hypothetical protein